MSNSSFIDDNCQNIQIQKSLVLSSIKKYQLSRPNTSKRHRSINTFKTPQNIVHAQPHWLTGDRFIPIRYTNEKSNLNSLLIKSHNINDSKPNLLLDTLLVKSVNDFSTEKNLIQKNKMLIFSKKTKSINQNTSKPFLIQMKNYLNSEDFLNENQSSYRQISTLPERILDAPQLQDDYYLNLLDWGNSNMLGVALGQEVFLWNGQTYETSQLMSTNQDNNTISSINFISSGNCIAIGLSNTTVELWDIIKETQIRSMKGHSGRVSSLSWNNYMLSSGSNDSSIISHDVRSKDHIISQVKAHKQEVCALKYNQDNTLLASGGNDNMVYIWDVRKLNNKLCNLIDATEETKPLMAFNHHNAAVKALGWCPWLRNVLATGGGTKDKKIKFFNCDQGTLLQSVNTGSQVCALLWNKREKELISSHGYNKNQIMIWKYPKMVQCAELKGHMSRVLYLVMSSDETTIVSGAGDETLRFWKINDQITPSHLNHKHDNFEHDLIIR